MSRISWQNISKNNDPLKIYCHNKKVTKVYPAHVIFDFVTSLTFFKIHFEISKVQALTAIYSTCTIDKKYFLLISLCTSQISRQNPKLETNSYFKLLQNRRFTSRLHAVSALRIYVATDARYFCFFFYLCYAVLSSESQ